MPYARHDRREGTDHRSEAREHQGFGAVYFVKFFGPADMVFVKKNRIIFFKNTRAHAPTKCVAHIVTQDGRRKY